MQRHLKGHDLAKLQEITCDHNKENNCELTNACSKKIFVASLTWRFVSVRYLMTEAKLDFMAGLKQQHIDQEIHCGM